MTSSLDATLDGPGGLTSDRMVVGGAVQLGGPLTLRLASNYTSQVGESLVLVDTPNLLFGTFAGLPEGSTIAVAGYEFTISYAGGDVTLTTTAVPFQATTTALATTVNPSVYGQAVTFTATVSATSGTPDGAVQFRIDGADVGTPVTLVSGVADFTTATLPAGTHSVVAIYLGSGGFLTSTSDTFTQTVGKATPVITWTDPAGIVYGTALSSAQLNAAADVAGTFVYGVPTGTVLDAGVDQPLTVTFTPADPANYNAAAATVHIDVGRAALVVTPADASRLYGAANPAFTGSLVGVVNGDDITASYATAAIPASPVGVYAITASLSDPDGRLVNYDVAFNVGQLTVTPAPSGTTLSVSAATPLFGVDRLTLTASVAGAAGTPDGSVTFYAGPVALGTVILAGGIAELALAPTDLAVGPHALTAVFAGGGNFTGSQGDATVTVIAPSAIQGLVWLDFNDDAEVNFGERSLPGVSVTLTGFDDLGQPVHQTVQTDADGVYTFVNVRPSGAAGYTITQTQPAGYPDGPDVLGTINGVYVGSAAVNDTFSGIVIPHGGVLAENYNFGERAPTTGTVAAGQTATIGFWQNKRGQNLIQALNGGVAATQLGHWLAATFPNMYAALAGKTNAEVAAHYKTLFARNGSNAVLGPPKTDAQVMATALAVYVTNQTLAGTTAAAYGFLVTADGVGAATFTVGTNGAAFGVANGSTMSVLDLLLAVNDRSHNGVLFDVDGSGQISSLEAAYRAMADVVFTAINEAGGV